MKSLLRRALNFEQRGEQQERISWDEYFMSTAELISRRSSCRKLHVGCVLVKDKRIIATGYNGHIPGQDHVSISKNGHEIATIHAEQNARDMTALRVGVNQAVYPLRRHVLRRVTAVEVMVVFVDPDSR